MQLGDEYADMQIDCDGVQGGLGSLMHLKKKHPHLQVVLSVGGGASNEIFPLAVSDAVRRDNFARSARGLVEASGLDGIDSMSGPFCHYCQPLKCASDLLGVSLLGVSVRPAAGRRLPVAAGSDPDTPAGRPVPADGGASHERGRAAEH